jgi:hypothetical protein
MLASVPNTGGMVPLRKFDLKLLQNNQFEKKKKLKKYVFLVAQVSEIGQGANLIRNRTNKSKIIQFTKRQNSKYI